MLFVIAVLIVLIGWILTNIHTELKRQNIYLQNIQEDTRTTNWLIDNQEKKSNQNPTK